MAARAYTQVMTLSASEFLEAAMNLPPSVRKDVALQLLESLDIDHDRAADEAWTSEISSRVDDILSGSVQTIPGEEVFARIGEHLDARDADRHA